MKRYRSTVLLCYLIYSQVTRPNPFPDYGTAYDLLLTKEFICVLGCLAFIYVNRACWKSSYENTHAQRHRYEVLYLQMTQKYLAEHLTNQKLTKELTQLKRQSKPIESYK